MYKCVFTITKKKTIAFLGMVLYLMAPYRLNDLYLRNAVSEFVSFLFIPMVIEGLYIIIKEQNKNSYLLAIGTIGIVLTHLVISMYLAIFCIIYMIIQWKKVLQKDIMKILILNVILAIGSTTFFLGPLLEQKLETQYEVFKPDRMQDMGGINTIEEFKIRPIQFIYTKQNDMIYEIGLVTLFGLVLTPLALRKIKKTNKKQYLYFFICGLISIRNDFNYFSI